MRISYEIKDVVSYKGEIGEVIERSIFSGYTVKLDNGKVISNIDPKNLNTIHAPLM